MKFNENLKYLRKERGLTQEKLAEKLNISRQAVAKWENGDSMPDSENLKEISNMFGVSIDQLLDNNKGKNNTFYKDSWILRSFIFNLIFLSCCVVCMIIIETINAVKNSDILVLAELMLTAIMELSVIITYKNNFITKKRIINMQETKEGKKERIKILMLNAVLNFAILLMLQLPIPISSLKERLLVIVLTILTTIMMFAYNYASMNLDVVKYNRKLK